MCLIYLSPVPWQSFAQRPHKFVHWFHTKTDRPVLWVDPYPTRFPSWKDVWRGRPSASANPLAITPTWLTVLKPKALPIEPLPGSGWINRRFWQRDLQQIIGFGHPSGSWLTIGKPSVLALEVLRILPNHSSLYDAMDEFPAFYAGLSRLALARRECLIAQRVDVISASSSELKARWERVHKDVRLVRNGLDLSATQRTAVDALKPKKKVFGYVGTIGSWFDWSWVSALARARSNDEIRLIGPVFEPPAGTLPGNVTLLPACSHEAALEAMSQFHVGLIPFKRNALTASVDPIKYYEYRALGLAVMSTDFGEMSLRASQRGVFITQSDSDLAHAAEAALRFQDDPDASRAFARDNAWEARFDAAELLPRATLD